MDTSDYVPPSPPTARLAPVIPFDWSFDPTIKASFSSPIRYESPYSTTLEVTPDPLNFGRQAHQIGPYSKPLAMAPAVLANANGTVKATGSAPATAAPIGPHPSYIHVADVYLFQQQLQSQLVAIGTNPTREDSFRLQGVQWINDVRAALQLYISSSQLNANADIELQTRPNILHSVPILPQVPAGPQGQRIPVLRRGSGGALDGV